MDTETYVDVINDLKPSVYVVPDVFKNAEATKRVWEEWRASTRYTGEALPMYVLHWCGSVWNTAQHLDAFYFDPTGPEIVGLAKAMGGWNRVGVARKLAHVGRVHALGFSDDLLLRELPLLHFEGVVSIDSTVPINRGLQGFSIVSERTKGWQPFHSKMFVGLRDGFATMADANLKIVDHLCK